MGVSIWFLVAMVLVGGVVAYLGDSIGRNIGKKRLRVGRLRPKHTAAIGTFVAGMVGTTATILVLFVLAEPVRSWIVEGERARSQLKIVTTQLEGLEGDLASKEKELEDRNAEIALKDTQIAENNATLLGIQNRNEELLAEQQRLIDEADRQKKLVQLALKEAEVTKAEISKLARQSADLQAKVDDTQKGLSEFQKEFNLIQNRNGELQRANNNLEELIAENEQTIEDLNGDILKAEQALDAAEKDYNEKIAENTRLLNESKNDLIAARNELGAVNEDLASLSAMLRARQGQIEEYTRTFDQLVGNLRTQPLTFVIGEEIARTVIPANTTRAQVDNAISSILFDSANEARDRGAVRGPNGSFVTVLSYSRYTRANSEPIPVTADAIPALLTARPDSTLLVSRAALNSFANEATPLAFTVYPNPVVYRQEDVVLELQMDGRDSEDQILDQIFDFLQENLYDQAVKDGMIPAIGQETPIGEVTRDMILEMASRVKAANRTIRLQLLAVADTRAGDKLRLTFRLRA